MRSGQYGQAREPLEKAVELAPDSADHQLDLATLYLELAQLQTDADERDAYLLDARRHFARSFKLKPVNPETLTLNALTYLLPGGDNDKAIASLEAAVNLLPSHPRPRRELALAYLAAGRRDEARGQILQLLDWASAEEVPALEQILQKIHSSQPVGAN